MSSENRRFQATAVIWSAALIFVIPIGLAVLATFGYAFSIGAQGGDQDMINQGVLRFTTSIPFLMFSTLVLFLIAFWRGWMFGKQLGSAALLHCLIAVVIALVLLLGIDIANDNVQIGSTLISWVLALGGGVLGTRVGNRV